MVLTVGEFLTRVLYDHWVDAVSCTPAVHFHNNDISSKERTDLAIARARYAYDHSGRTIGSIRRYFHQIIECVFLTTYCGQIFTLSPFLWAIVVGASLSEEYRLFLVLTSFFFSVTRAGEVGPYRTLVLTFDLQLGQLRAMCLASL